MAKTYTLVLEPIEDGWWMGSIKELPGARTQGRSVETVRRRIREAMEAYLDDHKTAYSATLVEEFAIPASMKRDLAALKKARAEADAQSKRVDELQRKLAKALAGRKISTRDAGAVLELTGARVQQLMSGK